MAEMTPTEKQQATVKFAEAMGWRAIQRVTVNPRAEGTFSLVAGYCWVRRPGNPCSDNFNPWNNLADAIELAEKLGLRPRQDLDRAGLWKAWKQDGEDSWRSVVRDTKTLCTAICEASLALLEERK